MKTKSALFILSLFFILTISGNAWSEEISLTDYDVLDASIMRPDMETRLMWIRAYKTAPTAIIDEEINSRLMQLNSQGVSTSLSLLNYLQYTPSERNQGSCGNCWVWAGTGIMEIALNVQNGITDRFSTQFLNSCKTDSYACCGGDLSDFASWYSGQGHAIPWSNTNASYQDGSRTCGSGASGVSCGVISTSPDYPISSITTQTITTQIVSQSTAIANIKNILNQNKGVLFGYFLATTADWNEFRNFWNNQTEPAIWNPDLYCGHTADSGFGGHAVLIVGYNDDDPDPANHYWLVLNSWGTAGVNRPNGLFRMKMNMNYDCQNYYPGYGWYYDREFQTLNVQFTTVTTTLTVNSFNPSSGVSITVIPSDNNGQGSGTTSFTRTYNNNTSVTLTAPSTAPNGNTFSGWSGCDNTSGSTCSVTMNAHKTVTANFFSTHLPKTGQTKCYNASGTEITCSGTGQDGEIQAGVAWPNPRFAVNGDCITDNLTGLMWTRDGNLPSGTKNWSSAIDYANNLTLCGYSDWRLPNLNELESLVNADVPDIATWLNTQGFTNVQSNDYWSSTTYAYNTGNSWSISFNNGGYLNYGIKNSALYYVLPVRAGQFSNADPLYPTNIWKTGQTISYHIGDDGDLEMGVTWPSPRFSATICVDGSTNCIIDNLTGLIWTKDAKTPGPSACTPGIYKTWQAALDYVECLNNNSYLGYTDWRLPNRKELRNLIDYSKFGKEALPTGHPFTNVELVFYWSSTTFANSSPYFSLGAGAWGISLFGGNDIDVTNKSYIYVYDPYSGDHYIYVWPVRGGVVGTPVNYYCDNDGDGYIDSSIDGTCTGSGCVPVGCQTTAGNDCNDNNPLEHPNQTWYQDADNDGYSNGNTIIQCSKPLDYKVASDLIATSGDCNDSNASIHPGATEVCNGIDDDCDGQIDEGVKNTYYRDADGDTYGNPNVTTQACTQPSGYVTDNTDCNDNDPKEHPNQTWYKDTDNDLYSDGTTNTTSCTRPAGYKVAPELIATSGDCNDNDSSVNSGATEGPYGNATCTDGKDNDCDTKTDAADTGCFPPDLLVSSWTAPANACTGATISIKDTTKNQGTGTAGESQTCFYFSTNTTLDSGDTKLGCRAIPSLPPGGISTGTTPVTLPNVPTGKYYLIAMADDGKVVTESNETNNKKTKVIYIGPDLTVVSIVPSPLKPVAGQNVNITVTVKNIGCPAAGPFRIDFYKNLSTAPALYQAGDFNCSISGGLAAGATAKCTGNVSYSPAGTYKMWAQVDTMQQVTEANEMNNNKSRLITINP